MLLAIQNLIEYLNRNYFNDDKLEEEVITMTKSLYDPEVEKQGIQKGIEQGIKQGIKQEKIEMARKLLQNNFSVQMIVELTELTEEEINEIKLELH